MTETPQANSKKQFLLIAAIAISVTVIPYIMFYTGIGIPTSTVNKGILLENPQPVDNYPLTDKNGQPWLISQQEPKFRLVFLVSGDCDEACENMLYVTRQVRIRLSKEMDQLERLYINLGDPLDNEFSEYLAEEHPDLKVLDGDRQQWHALLAEQPNVRDDLNGHEYFLIHRYGAMVMAYTEEQTGNELLKDLKFLIKSSN